MTTRDSGAQPHRIFDEEAHDRAYAAMRAVADGLGDQGLDILGQEWQEAHYLKATNAWGALCEATVGADGFFTWEYRPSDGTWDEPAEIAAMILALLGADTPAGGLRDLLARYPGQSMRSAVGLTARAHGMHARLAGVIGHEDFLEIDADVEITNPARPERGGVLYNGRAVRWKCRLASPDAAGAGLQISEISKTVGSSVPQLQVLNARHDDPRAARS